MFSGKKIINDKHSKLQNSLQSNKESAIHRVKLFLNYHLLPIVPGKVSNT